jgi:phosphoserine phosphatase
VTCDRKTAENAELSTYKLANAATLKPWSDPQPMLHCGPEGQKLEAFEARESLEGIDRDRIVLAQPMAKSNEIRVLLVRTGETEWERDGRIAGHTDVPLSDAGRQMAAQIAREFEGERIGTVFCGPDEASMATGEQIGRVTGARVKTVACLAEINLGLWEGILQRDLEDKCPRAFRQWMDDPSVVQVPEGETVDEAQERILAGLSKIVDKARADHGAVAIVLRPVAMGLVGCALNGVPTSSLWSMIKTGVAVQWQTLQRGTLRRGMQAKASA